VGSQLTQSCVIFAVSEDALGGIAVLNSNKIVHGKPPAEISVSLVMVGMKGQRWTFRITALSYPASRVLARLTKTPGEVLRVLAGIVTVADSLKIMNILL